MKVSKTLYLALFKAQTFQGKFILSRITSFVGASIFSRYLGMKLFHRLTPEKIGIGVCTSRKEFVLTEQKAIISLGGNNVNLRAHPNSRAAFMYIALPSRISLFFDYSKCSNRTFFGVESFLNSTDCKFTLGIELCCEGAINSVFVRRVQSLFEESVFTFLFRCQTVVQSFSFCILGIIF